MRRFYDSLTLFTVAKKNKYTPRLMVFLFCPFRPPSKRKYDTNDISLESPDIGLLEFKKKLGVASSRGRHCPIN